MRQFTDTERIDCLERMANRRGGILLHDGSETGRTGLGLRPGSLVRTLREAVDCCLRAELGIEPPRQLADVAYQLLPATRHRRARMAELPEPAAWCWEQYGRANEYCFENEWFWCYDSTKPDESDHVTVRNEAPLYTADQLSAAIQAERGRILCELDGLRCNEKAVNMTGHDVVREELLDDIEAAIRGQAEGRE